MFTDYYSRKSTPFDKLLENILKGLKSGWRSSKARETYLKTFSMVIWEALSECDKIRHSLSYCEACCMEYLSVQEVFPLKPVFNSCKPNTEHRETTINSLVDGIINNPAAGTRKALEVLNTSVASSTGKSFNTLVDLHDKKLSSRESAKEKLQNNIELLSKIRDNANSFYKQNAALTMLTENESKSSYNRKRKALYFQENVCDTPKRKKSYLKGRVAETVLQKLTTAIEEERTIQWKSFASECGLNSSDSGARVKIFAMENGLNITKLEGETKSTETKRHRRILPKMTGSHGRISFPCPPSLDEVNKDIAKMLVEGQLNVGQPCAPMALERYMPDGNIQIVQAHGNKIPLTELRQKLLDKHRKYMRLTTDEEITKMSLTYLRSEVSKYISNCESLSRPEIEHTFKKLQRKRHLIMWNDHSTLFSYGLLLITVKTAYDPAVFYTNSEVPDKKGSFQFRK